MTFQLSWNVTAKPMFLFLIGLFVFESHGTYGGKRSGYEIDRDYFENFGSDYSSGSDNYSGSSDSEDTEQSVEKKNNTPKLEKRRLKCAGHWTLKTDTNNQGCPIDPPGNLVSESDNRRRFIEEEKQNISLPRHSPFSERKNNVHLSQFEKQERLLFLQQCLRSLSLSAELQAFAQEQINTMALPGFRVSAYSTFITSELLDSLSNRLVNATGTYVINDDYNRNLLNNDIIQYFKGIDEDALEIIVKTVKDTLLLKETETNTFNITDLNFMFFKLDVTNTQGFLSFIEDVSNIQNKIETADNLRADLQQTLKNLQQRDELRAFFALFKDGFQDVKSPFARDLDIGLCGKSFPQTTIIY